MLLSMLQVKIHRARVTDANLDYVGSITIGKNLLLESGLIYGQEVHIVNNNNGERFTTYVLETEEDNVICLNGAAARKVEKNDVIIIIAYGLMNDDEIKNHKPKSIFVDDKNNITEVILGQKGK